MNDGVSASMFPVSILHKTVMKTCYLHCRGRVEFGFNDIDPNEYIEEIHKEFILFFQREIGQMSPLVF